MNMRTSAAGFAFSAALATGCGIEAEPRLNFSAVPAVESSNDADRLHQLNLDTTHATASEIKVSTVTEAYTYPEIIVTKGILRDVEVIEITEPQFYGVELPEITEPQLNDEEVAVGSPPVPEIESPIIAPDLALATINMHCEAVHFDIPSGPVDSDILLTASVDKIPATIPDDVQSSEQFAVAGTGFEDFYFDDLEVGGTYSFILDATYGVVKVNLVSVAVGGIEPCENEGDGEQVTAINGPIDVLTSDSQAVRGQRINIED